MTIILTRPEIAALTITSDERSEPQKFGIHCKRTFTHTDGHTYSFNAVVPIGGGAEQFPNQRPDGTVKCFFIA